MPYGGTAEVGYFEDSQIVLISNHVLLNSFTSLGLHFSIDFSWVLLIVSITFCAHMY